MLVAATILAFRCGIGRSDTCETAYAKYLECYPDKKFSSEKQKFFCSAFVALIRPNCTACDVTSMMD